MSQQVSLRVFATRGEAEIVQGLLAAAGIDSRVSSDDAGGAYPFPLSDGVRLMVDERDLDAAQQLLADLP